MIAQTSVSFHMQIIAEHSECRVFSTRFKMTEDVVEAQRGSDPCLPPIGELFLNIDGVESIRLKTYSVFITKNPAFSWDEIQARLSPIFDDMHRTLSGMTKKLEAEIKKSLRKEE